ncbi:MAG: hypothetical protein ABSH20_08615 [Tepidisphaeraceae bacterium]|jgi:hypothetical protein
MGRSLCFFAADDDLYPVLFPLLEKHKVRIYHVGRVEGKPLPIRSSEVQTGTTKNDQHGLGPVYLFMPDDLDVRVRVYNLVTGERIGVIDQLANNDSVTLCAGGRRPDNVVIDGDMGTAWKSDFSDSLLRDFASALRKQFVKVKAYWVGPKALAILRSGGRLTHALQSPPLYDLKE